MFGKGKKDGNAGPSVAASAGKPAVQLSSSADAGEKAEAPKAISSIGSDMTIVGKIVCDGVLQVFGRIEGELRATNVLIGNGAHVEGEILAYDSLMHCSILPRRLGPNLAARPGRCAC